jgi:hypothetical protein
LKNVTESFYGVRTINPTQNIVWIKQTSAEGKTLQMIKRSGPPTTLRTDPNVEKVTEMVINDC